MKPIGLIHSECRRGCGRKLSTLSRSLYSMPKHIKEKYHLICSQCMTRKEEEEMLREMTKYVQKAINNA